MAAKLLVATTTWWPSVGILASALEQAGFEVTMLCPRGHVAARAVRFASLELDRGCPAASLADAVARLAPDLVVAADDRAVGQLRDLGRAQPNLRPLVERSLGAAACHALLTARVPLLAIAAEVGFATPAARAIRTEHDLAAWLDRIPPPWVLKVDGAWGGEGVRIVHTRGAATRAFAELRRGLPVAFALKRRFLNGDPMPWQERREAKRPEISVQAFVEGRPATCGLFALAGEVLGVTMVEAVVTCGERGPATLMRAIERPDVVADARRLVRRLHLSGFIGLDFLIAASGTAHLLEMNPRITGPCRLRGPGGIDPVTAAARAFACRPRDVPPMPRTLFASFPLAWLEDPGASDLLLCREDLPWREPAMLRDALRPLWPERGMLAFLPARLRKLRRRLLRQDTRPDFRLKPFAWWHAQASLQPPERMQDVEPLAESGSRSAPA